MDRDYGKEIDNINTQLSEIKELLKGTAASAKPIRPPKDHCQQGVEQILSSDKRMAELQKELYEKADQEGTGLVTYFGTHSSGNNDDVHQSHWISQNVETNRLFEIIENNSATKVLACIGSNDRLNLLLALLRAPRTAAQLVEECGYNTTGQVYHHLNPLLAADLVKGKSKGVYMIQPHRVQGIIMLLAGISDMLDTRYTQGNWDTEK